MLIVLAPVELLVYRPKTGELLPVSRLPEVASRLSPTATLSTKTIFAILHRLDQIELTSLGVWVLFKIVSQLVVFLGTSTFPCVSNVLVDFRTSPTLAADDVLTAIPFRIRAWQFRVCCTVALAVLTSLVVMFGQDSSPAGPKVPAKATPSRKGGGVRVSVSVPAQRQCLSTGSG